MNRPLRSPGEIKGINFELFQPIEINAREPLVVQYLAGSGSRLVVALSGVGVERKVVPPREFTGAASAGGKNHVLFISDRARSWMNAPGMAEALVNLVKRFVEFHDLTEVVALGNSMGGFDALVLADLIPVQTVIAFAPQFSMHPDIVPEEPRWNYHRDRIETWTWRDVGAMRADNTAYFIFHGDNALEARHWLRFPEGGRINHYIFKGIGHDVSARLRKRRLLAPVIETALDNKPRKLRKMIESSALGKRFEFYRRDVYMQKFPEIVQCVDASGQTDPSLGERNAP